MESPNDDPEATPTNSECNSPDGLIAVIVVLLVIIVILIVIFIIIVLVLIRKKKLSTDTVNTLANDDSNNKRHKRTFWKYRRSGSQKAELFSHPVFMSKANSLESSHSSQTDLVPKKQTGTEALNKRQKKSDDTTVQKEIPISEKEKILDKNSEDSSKETSVVTDIAVVDNPSYTLHKQSKEPNKSNTAAKKNENIKKLEKINEESKETDIVLDEDIVTNNPSYNVRRSSSNATEAYTYVKSEEHSRPKSWAVQSSIDESVGVYVDLDIELERKINHRSKIPLPTQESFENDYVWYAENDFVRNLIINNNSTFI